MAIAWQDTETGEVFATKPPAKKQSGWAGHAKARARLAKTLPVPCHKCGGLVTEDMRWHVDHDPPRAFLPKVEWTNPEFQFVSHKRCNESAGATLGNKMRAKGRKPRVIQKRTIPVESSMPATLTLPAAKRTISPAVRPEMPWGTPRFMTEWPDNAQGSFFDEMESWLATDGGIDLRPWQREILRRILAWEWDQDTLEKRLCFRVACISTPRQSGKSVLARAYALMRCQHADLFGEPQTVMHLAHRHAAARRIHAQTWGLARRNGLKVRAATGNERIIWADSSEWAVSTLGTVFGATAGGELLDECHGVDPDRYREAVQPISAARRFPQLLAISTANSQATPLMPGFMKDGLLGIRRTFLADYGADPDDDPNDLAVWKKASPHFDTARKEEMELAVGSPQFASQWLNLWNEGGEAWRWIPKALTDTSRAVLDWPPNDTGTVGIESRWNPSETAMPARWAVAIAWSVGDDLTLSRVERADTLAEALTIAGDRRIVAHASTVQQMAAHGRTARVTPLNLTTARSAGETLSSAVRARRLRIHGLDDVTWAGCRVYPSDAGDVIDSRKSLSDPSALKALSYAVHTVATAVHSGPFLVA